MDMYEIERTLKQTFAHFSTEHMKRSKIWCYQVKQRHSRDVCSKNFTLVIKNGATYRCKETEESTLCIFDVETPFQLHLAQYELFIGVARGLRWTALGSNC